MNLSKYIYNQNWNIGFVECSATKLIKNKSLGKIQWMKHKYKDRFFADPFILKVSEESIVLFAEELKFDTPKGRIVELVVDVKTKELKKRYLLLETETHLSYPAIMYVNNTVYVYPENGASGALNLYRYNKTKHCLCFEKTLVNESLTDATIYQEREDSWMITTKAPETQEKAYLYKSKNQEESFIQTYSKEIVAERSHSRPAGNFFKVNDELYRPAQDCEKRYGAAISIMKVEQLENVYRERLEFKLHPMSFRYNLGLHTLNFKDNVCVIDGYGYLYPIIGRIYNYLSQIKQLFNIIIYGSK